MYRVFHVTLDAWPNDKLSSKLVMATQVVSAVRSNEDVNLRSCNIVGWAQYFVQGRKAIWSFKGL